MAIFEPRNNWSLRNLVSEHGEAPLRMVREAYPDIASTFYDADTLQPELLEDADLVIVHERNDREVVERIGQFRHRLKNVRLLFHDTHHRSVTAPETLAWKALRHYDGVLVYGEAIRKIYRSRGWSDRVWTWHEAADTRVFYPRERERLEGDLVWIGNWGDEERTAEIQEFFLRPVADSGIKARAYGVRYPQAARDALNKADIEYGGWLPNYRAPEVFANFCATLHIPRRPYTESLPGIPTIRPFEALACGIPLISSPWEDSEELFRPGDFLIARNGDEVKEHLWTILNDQDFAREMAERGRQTILERHTCAHRVDELLAIGDRLGLPSSVAAVAS